MLVTMRKLKLNRFRRMPILLRVLFHQEPITLDDIINDIITTAASLMGRDLSGPPLSEQSAWEMTEHYTPSKASPRFLRVVEVIVLWLACYFYTW
jgi:hypothetical protein